MGNLFTKEKSKDSSCRPSRGSDGYPRQNEQRPEPVKPLPEVVNPVPSAPEIPEEGNVWTGTSDSASGIKTPEAEKHSVNQEETPKEMPKTPSKSQNSLKSLTKSSSRHSVKISQSTSKHSKIELEELSVKDLPQPQPILTDDPSFSIHGQHQKTPSEKSAPTSVPQTPSSSDKPQVPSVLGNLSKSSSRKSLRTSKPTTPLDAPNSPFRSPTGKKSPLVKSPSAQSPLAQMASSPTGSQKSGLVKSPSATSPLVETRSESSGALKTLIRSSSNTGSLGKTNSIENFNAQAESPSQNANPLAEADRFNTNPAQEESIEAALEPVFDGKIDGDAAEKVPRGQISEINEKTAFEEETYEDLPKSSSKTSIKSPSPKVSNSGSQKSLRSSKSQNFDNLSKSSSRKSVRSSSSNQDFTEFSKSDSSKMLSVLSEGQVVEENLAQDKESEGNNAQVSKSFSKRSLHSQKSTTSTGNNNRVISPTMSEEPISIIQGPSSGVSESSSKKSLFTRSISSEKQEKIGSPAGEVKSPSGGNPFGEVTNMNSSIPDASGVYDGSQIKPSQSIDTEGGMTCDEISFGESIKSDQEISQDPQLEAVKTEEYSEPWGASECSLQKTPTGEENFGTEENQSLEKISKSSSKKSFKQLNDDLTNPEENKEDINDFL
ncbi:Oidioi.mRNA.OKI2018_I69.chr2.g5268.t1.cds [Oikopleura dioica]|uniref:Oidioi.mRNA.OKI2018_I69.chr2.g5268.t1.cds n=1 Tax=Oikopleura dioica TaxID=34765 RepID=A0ABN7T0C8_OIKDI|nr:Oidioi.mRNA.OKI2018_I69.chr2.g5268.t1.cds [Oikopleura dioica]